MFWLRQMNINKSCHHFSQAVNIQKRKLIQKQEAKTQHTLRIDDMGCVEMKKRNERQNDKTHHIETIHTHTVERPFVTNVRDPV